jgi:hypothetical protein
MDVSLEIRMIFGGRRGHYSAYSREGIKHFQNPSLLYTSSDPISQNGYTYP